MRLKSLFICMACVIAPLAPARCFAHASLVASSPQDAATIPSGRVEMELRFNSRIDPKLSRLTLVMVDNQRVIRTARNDPRLRRIESESAEFFRRLLHASLADNERRRSPNAR